ncbi:thyroxine 5-deiodinase-like [Glandiceps talaboti]
MDSTEEAYRNRDLVAKVAKRLKEIMFADETMKLYDDRMMPLGDNAALLTAELAQIHRELGVKAFKEYGVDILETPTPAHSKIRQLWHTDKEIMDYLEFTSDPLVVPFHSRENPPKVGDSTSDLDLYTVDTARPVRFKDLHVHKERPLVAIVHSGSLRKLFDDYKDKVDFLMVYMYEAHPAEGWRFGTHYSTVSRHRNIKERIDAAQTLIDLDSTYNTFSADLTDRSKIPIVCDNMDNEFDRVYAALPDRTYAIEEDKIKYIGRLVFQQMQSQSEWLMTDEMREWLEGRFGKAK